MLWRSLALAVIVAAGVGGLAARPAHAQEMFQWASPLFPEENAELRRIRQAAFLFSVSTRRSPVGMR